MLGENGSHPLAGLQALAGHRHQEFHGYLCRNPALPHLLLNVFRQPLYQSRIAAKPPSRYGRTAAPTHPGCFRLRIWLPAVLDALSVASTFGRSALRCPASSPGISAGPLARPISAPHSGTPCCNSALSAAARDENAGPHPFSRQHRARGRRTDRFRRTA